MLYLCEIAFYFNYNIFNAWVCPNNILIQNIKLEIFLSKNSHNNLKSINTTLENYKKTKLPFSCDHAVTAPSDLVPDKL